MDNIKYLINGDFSILVKFGDEIDEKINHTVNTFNKMIIGCNHSGIDETIPLYCALMIIYKPEIIKCSEIIDLSRNLAKGIKDAEKTEKEIVEIPVLYGGETGPDLGYVAWHNNLSEDDVIKYHSNEEYLIYMLGFTPGFPYLGGMNKRISTPRLEIPRVKISAGSVGIAGEQTGIYPVSSPGGWQIIGQTPIDLYDAERETPILLKSGQYIKFKPITQKEFNKIKSLNKWQNLFRLLMFKRKNKFEAIKIQENDKAGINIITPGFMTTVQDLGRYKYQAFGVPVSGAMDQKSLKIANLLVNNDINEAGLEITMIGPSIEFTGDNIIAIAGADLTAQLNGVNIKMNTAVLCRKNDVLAFKGMKSGSRAYLAFAGGLGIKSVMGSKSTYVKASIGGYEGRKLEKGDFISFENPKIDIQNLNKRSLNICSDYGNEINLRVIMGPQDDYFTQKGIDTFLQSTYKISNEFDRMGCRLDGEKIEHKKDGNIISDGIAFGAIQVPSHGTPIIMLADRQTVGGYTKIANVISVDLPKLAQAKSGDKVSFSKISVEEAQELYIKEINEIEEIKNNLNEPAADISVGNNLKKPSNLRHYNITINNKVYAVTVDEEM